MNIIDNDVSRRLSKLPHNNYPKMIILHHAEATGIDINEIDRWHLNNGWSGFGYHYYVRKDGKIYKGRPDYTMGAHCLHHNKNTIGICAEGRYTVEKMPDVQKNSIIELCKSLNIKEIKAHREMMSTDCPGKNYPIDEIRNAVSKNTSEQTTITMSDELELQANLNRLKITDGKGNRLSVDGVIGMRSIEAIKRIQEICNLSVDGIAGRNTKNAISEILNTPLLRRGSRGIPVRYLQYRVGVSRDGIFGSNTETYTIAWQKRNLLSADGIVGKNSWKILLG